jgi:hypothetical protein
VQQDPYNIEDIGNGNVQNSSPSNDSSSSPFFSVSKHFQSHSGYSSSGNAKGSSLPFKKFKPFNTVPAGADDTGIFALLFGFTLVPSESTLTFGVSGVENGCAALGGDTGAGLLVAGDDGEAVVVRVRDRSEGTR